MPRLSISILGSSHNGDLISLDLPEDLTVGGLKDLIKLETQIDPATQHYYFNGRAVRDDGQTLASVGVKDGDMIAMVQRDPQEQGNTARQSQQHARQPMSGQQTSASGGGGARSVAVDANSIEQMRRRMLSDASAMSQLRTQQPVLYEAIQDPARFRQVWQEMARADQEREGQRRDELQLLNGDPMNIDMQMRIEEMIRQEQVMENLQFAYQHSPEVFARVTMLYIPVTVNSYPVKAFVDSGAQTTIMSPSCAEACGIMRLIDRRYSGIAKGVGTAQILGRVHAADMTIGLSTMSCSFTVMEGKDVDLLLGLDMLKRFQAIIDLKQNKLIFGPGNDVEFLGEADIPKNMDDAQQAEPTVSGPNGTEIGAKTGTVKPAGTSEAAAAQAANNAASSASPAGYGAAGSAEVDRATAIRNAFQGLGRTLGAQANTQQSSPGQARPSAAPAGSRPAVAPPGPPTSSSSRYSADTIAQLTSLGFSEEQVVQALDACEGNVEHAASLLFGGFD